MTNMAKSLVAVVGIYSINMLYPHKGIKFLFITNEISNSHSDFYLAIMHIRKF
jgi:hypothetical protein